MRGYLRRRLHALLLLLSVTLLCFGLKSRKHTHSCSLDLSSRTHARYRWMDVWMDGAGLCLNITPAASNWFSFSLSFSHFGVSVLQPKSYSSLPLFFFPFFSYVSLFSRCLLITGQIFFLLTKKDACRRSVTTI